MICLSYLPYFLLLLFASYAPHMFSTTYKSHNIAIIGSGYVGLVSGCSLASIGNIVTCVDNNQEKIDTLNRATSPMYEPYLDDMISQNVQEKRLSFSTHVEEAIQKAQIIFIVVGTPMDDTGQTDLSALDATLKTIGAHLTDYKIICIKSTVPVGTNETAKKTLKQYCGHENFDIVSNPEFLREGSAFTDFFEKNPIVLGSNSDAALDCMVTIYKPLIDKGRILIKTNFATAELIKYAWNAFSAIKIAYVNELSRLCTKVDAHMNDLIFGMSFSDDLLPMRNIKPGLVLVGHAYQKIQERLCLLQKQWALI